MTGKVEQFSELQRKNMEAAMRLAQMSIENSQRIMGLQSELARQLFQSTVDNAKSQGTVKAPQELLTLRTQYAQETAQRMMETAQKIAEVGNEARTEFSRMLTEQLASGSHDMMEAFQNFFKTLPGQNANVLENMQQAMATANSAFDQIAKASAASFTDATKGGKKK
ncbi:MAG: phasin family protein [Gammaproteobacteria bacterium]|nr:phasin family protein [Gammaproteobacteria bacterium]MBU1644770.1 phasin family protein [Gammaproteobacteria bacterium]MBU1973504.1 phasin family protein [Gammaproteobacteria bacterium]